MINNNSTGFAVVAAADGSLNTNSDYKVISGTGAPWSSDLTHGVGIAGDGLTPSTDGIYKVETWLDIVGFPTNTSRLALKYVINGNQYSLNKISVKSNSAGDAGNLSGFWIVQLSAGDTVQLAVASSDAGNIIFESGNASLTLVRAL